MARGISSRRGIIIFSVTTADGASSRLVEGVEEKGLEAVPAQSTTLSLRRRIIPYTSQKNSGRWRTQQGRPSYSLQPPPRHCCSPAAWRAFSSLLFSAVPPSSAASSGGRLRRLARRLVLWVLRLLALRTAVPELPTAGAPLQLRPVRSGCRPALRTGPNRSHSGRRGCCRFRSRASGIGSGVGCWCA